MRFIPATPEEFHTAMREGRRFDFPAEFSELANGISALYQSGYPFQLGVVTPDRSGWQIPVAMFGRPTATERLMIVTSGERFLERDLILAAELSQLQPEAVTLISPYGFAKHTHYADDLAAAVVDDSAKRVFLVPLVSDPTREILTRSFVAATNGNPTIYPIHNAIHANPSEIAASIAEYSRANPTAVSYRLAQRARLVRTSSPVDLRQRGTSR